MNNFAPPSVKAVNQAFSADDSRSSREIGPHTELSLILPVLGLWCGLFFPLLLLECTTAVWWETLEMSLVTLSGLGILMVVLWTALFGELSLQRVAKGLLLLMLFSSIAGALTRLVAGDPHAIPQTGVIIFFLGTTCIVPAVAFRRLLGWQILSLHGPQAFDARRFHLREAFQWTAFVALILAMTRFLLAVSFEQDSQRLLVFITFVIGLPTAITFCFLHLCHRLTIGWLLAAIPLLGTSAAIAVSLLVYLVSTWGTTGDVEVREAFRLAAIWFSLAGYFLAGIHWYLRRRGVFFFFGFGPPPQALSDAKTYYRASLDRRIKRLQVRTQQLQRDLAHVSPR